MQGFLAKSKKTGWKVCGIDCAGLDLPMADDCCASGIDALWARASKLRSKISRTLRVHY